MELLPPLLLKVEYMNKLLESRDQQWNQILIYLNGAKPNQKDNEANVVEEKITIHNVTVNTKHKLVISQY